jgi:hypothetical protein
MKEMRDGYRNDCKACNLLAKRARYQRDPKSHIERVQRWREKNPERYRSTQQAYKAKNRQRIQQQNRERHLRKKYGLSLGEFESLVDQQLGRCAICKIDLGSDLHVDHEHVTGRIRGLLCGKCNKAVGLLNDDPTLIRAAARYLERSAAEPTELRMLG